ncbi:Myb-like DNA-binding domain-containing protein [Spironucleus salmonicida]|uniref:Myb-like DNA-binding domain-containing protein n=1 Tax=Spironucleus salmonicida TaxID=348837 RepID=V6LYF7_9EUKA|nr:Myb-like DNA-binding domain-containing protein [Spironucleus salmonicida]|eukprot:EST48746.1 Myb-like DNA-binding domain-containing protein [Spironucleus salmonicida]
MDDAMSFRFMSFSFLDEEPVTCFDLSQYKIPPLPQFPYDHELPKTFSINRVFLDCESVDFKLQRKEIWPWCPVSDQILLTLVQEFGSQKWRLISQIINNQCKTGANWTPKQCNQRYHRVIKQDFVKGRWTKDQDDKLYFLLNEFPNPNEFTKVVERFVERSDNQIRYRIKKLYPHYFKGLWK